MLLGVGRSQDWEPIEVLDQATLEVVTGPLLRVPGTDQLLIGCTAAGVPRAIAAHCPHRQRRLDEYARTGSRPGTLVCSAHGYEFEVATGRCLSAAGRAEGLRLPTWELVDQPDGTKAARLDRRPGG